MAALLKKKTHFADRVVDESQSPTIGRVGSLQRTMNSSMSREKMQQNTSNQASFTQQRTRRMSTRNINKRAHLNTIAKSITNSFQNSQRSFDSTDPQHENLTPEELERRKNERKKRKRKHDLHWAFSTIQAQIREESDLKGQFEQGEHWNAEWQVNKIRNLHLVKILADYEEYSEYENIFTGNKRAEFSTQDLNKRIQDFVADSFKGVKFKKDYQESSNEALQAFDSGSGSEESPKAYQTGQSGQQQELQYVKNSAILYCNEFHDELETWLRENGNRGTLNNPAAMHSYFNHSSSQQQKNAFDGLEHAEQNVQMQSKLMLVIIKRILKTLHSQLSGETNIVQCFLLEIKDIKDMQANVDITYLKKFHKECFNELNKLVHQIQIDRFMIFLLEFMPEEIQKLSRKKKQQDENATNFDFLIRQSTKMLKRTCKFILAFNYLLVHRKMTMLTEVGSHLKIFVSETCDLLIEKLQIFQSELVQNHHKIQKELDAEKQLQINIKNNQNNQVTEQLKDGPITKNENVRKSTTGIPSDQQNLLGRAFTRQAGLRKSSRFGGGNPLLKMGKDNEKKLQSKVDFIQLKLKNTKRALNITKTLFGMVDEMDSTDFLVAQKDTAQVVLLQDKTESVDQLNQETDMTGLENGKKRSSDIVDLVHQIEIEMGSFKYSKLKITKSPQKVPQQRTTETFYNQGATAYNQEMSGDAYGRQDSAQFEQSSDMSSSSALDSSILRQASLQHNQENIGGQNFDLKKFQAQDHADDFLNHFFVDPFKYHQLAREVDAANKGVTEDFRAYQEGDNLTKKSPAVTFGKGGRRPPQNGIAVEESPSVPISGSQDENRMQAMLAQQQHIPDLDLTSIVPTSHLTGSELLIKEDVPGERDNHFFSLTYDNKNDSNQKQLNQEEEDFLQNMIEQYKKDIGGHFISDGRIEAFARQVIPHSKLRDIMKLQDNKRNNFQEILSNLLFSANNPFQAELPQIHDLSFQQQTDARKKHDFVSSGSLSYIFDGKHLTFKTMVDHLERDETKGKGIEGNGLASLHTLGGNNNQADRISPTSMEGGVGSSRAGADSIFAGSMGNASNASNARRTSAFQLKQIKDNMRFAMSRASRFLDTSLKVSELEQREKIFEQEVDELLLAEENEVKEEELYDSVKPQKIMEDDEDGHNKHSETENNSEADMNATSKSKKRKSRRQLQKQTQRISRLLEMHTSDFKFFRPTAASFQRMPSKVTQNHLNLAKSTNLLYDHSQNKRETNFQQPSARDNILKEMEIQQAKFLLKRQRYEEMNLRKSTFERERKGFDDYMFEANSMQHRQDAQNKQAELSNVMKQLQAQYSRQLSFRDPNLQSYMEEIEGIQNTDSFDEYDNNDIEQTYQDYEQSKYLQVPQSNGEPPAKSVIQRHNLNTSKISFSHNQPISMLEMVFNEINPYRENNLLDINNSGGSMNLKSHSTGFYGNQTIEENNSLTGGSLKLPNTVETKPSNEKLVTMASLENNETSPLEERRRLVNQNSFGAENQNIVTGQGSTNNRGQQDLKLMKSRASEHIVRPKKQSTLRELVNNNSGYFRNSKESQQDIGLNDKNQFLSNTSSLPKEQTLLFGSEATFMDPSNVMGMGARKNTRITNAGDTELENSAVLQFQELQTAFGHGSTSDFQQLQTAGFGGSHILQDQSSQRKLMMNGTLISSIGDDLKRSDMDMTPPQKKNGGHSDDVLVEDFDGGYTPEFQERVKQIQLHRQRTQTMQ